MRLLWFMRVRSRTPRLQHLAATPPPGCSRPAERASIQQPPARCPARLHGLSQHPPSGQSAEVPRYVPGCVYRPFHVGRREPAAPVRTHTSLPPVWTPNTSSPPATACRAEKRNTCPVGRRTWTCWRSSSQKAVNILSIATTSFSGQKDVSRLLAVTYLPGEAITDPRRNSLAGYAAPALPRLSRAFWQVGKAGNSG